jgi:hypothetical protein
MSDFQSFIAAFLGPHALSEEKTHLIKIKHQIQLAYVAKKAIQHFHEEMYSLEIRQLIIIGVHARAEEEPCVPPVHDFVGAELHEVGLVFLIARSHEPVHLFVAVSPAAPTKKKNQSSSFSS